MTLKNYRAPLLSNIKLCASFHHLMWIQNGVTVWKRLSWVLTSLTWTFDLWPFAWTSFWSLVITPENCMINDGNIVKKVRRTDRRTENTIHRAAWSQLKTIRHLFYTVLHRALCIISNPSVNSNWSNSPETLNLGKNCWFFVTRDLEIWWVTLKNNRAPLLYYIKLCAAFQSHWYIQTGVTVR